MKRQFFVLVVLTFLTNCKESKKEINYYVGTYSCIRYDTVIASSPNSSIDTTTGIESFIAQIEYLSDSIYCYGKAIDSCGNHSDKLVIKEDKISEYPYNPIQYVRGSFSPTKLDFNIEKASQSMTLKTKSNCNCKWKF